MRRRRARALLIHLGMMMRILLVLLASVTVAHAAESRLTLEESLSDCRKLGPDKKLRLTLHGEVGAPEIIAALAPLSCRPLILGGSASHGGKVAIEAPDLMSAREATRLLVTALDSLGLSLEEAGASLRVVDSGRGREIASPLGAAARGREAFVLRLVRLAEAGADEVATTVGKLRSKDGEVVAVPQSRSLLLVDRQAQVERMEALARALDRPAVPSRIFVLPVHRQRPSELTDVLEKVAIGTQARGDKDPARPLLFAVDAARVLLFSGNELAFHRVEALLARIDPPLEPGEERGGRIAVVYLKHVGAEELAATLKEVLTQARAARPAGAPGVAAAVEGEIKVTADKTSNALIVSGSPADLEAVRELVGRLDLPRRQVYVEAAILDLSADLSRAVGIALHQGAARADGSLTGLVSSSSSSSNSVLASIDATSLAQTVSGAGLLGAVFGKGFDVAGVSVPSFGVVLKALETSKNASVISRPHLMTLDHAKASLSVGQRIPFPLSSLASVAGPGLAQQKTYSREKVALSLDLTPHISDDNELRLEIEGVIEDVEGGANTEGGPTTNNRTIKTTVVVQDGETIVLGGLQKEIVRDSVEKVPGLGDIPVLGRLFQTRSKQRVKQDLLIVLTPYVVRDATDLRRIHERKEAERRELMERATMFDDPNAYEAHVDYRRKRGLLEEINRVVYASMEESRALADARAALAHRHGIEPGEVHIEERPDDRP